MCGGNQGLAACRLRPPGQLLRLLRMPPADVALGAPGLCPLHWEPELQVPRCRPGTSVTCWLLCSPRGPCERSASEGLGWVRTTGLWAEFRVTSSPQEDTAGAEATRQGPVVLSMAADRGLGWVRGVGTLDETGTGDMDRDMGQGQETGCS